MRCLSRRFWTEILGSNSDQVIDVCPRLSVLCCPVKVEVLCRTYPPSRES
jgi:hypothetical protein